MTVQFPKRLKLSKENPIIDFYKKCMQQINNTSNLDNVNVTAFTVNPKDYKKLNQALKKHMRKNYPTLPEKKIKFEMGMFMLDIGPRVNSTAPEGSVLVNEEELYGNFKS